MSEIVLICYGFAFVFALIAKFANKDTSFKNAFCGNFTYVFTVFCVISLLLNLLE